MNPFEDELRKALRRQDPSGDFSERLFAKIGEKQREKNSTERESFRRWLWPIVERKWQWGTVILIICLGSGGVLYREHAQTERGEAAKEQLLLAMRITNQQLHIAQLRVRQMEKFEKEME